MKLHCEWCHEEVKVTEGVISVKCGRCAMLNADYIAQEQDKKDVDRCYHHPGYRANTPPRGVCKTCWKIWGEKVSREVV